MTHDSSDHHAETPSQGIFIGWLGIGLIAVMAIFTLTLFIAGATHGFS